MKKLILGLTLGLGAINAQTPIEAAQSTPEITQQIFSDYLSGYDTHSVLQHLHHTQELLRDSVHNPELNNLLDYLDVCLKDLDRSVSRPATEANAHHVDDLLKAITEGNLYIIDTIDQNDMVIASR